MCGKSLISLCNGKKLKDFKIRRMSILSVFIQHSPKNPSQIY